MQTFINLLLFYGHFFKSEKNSKKTLRMEKMVPYKIFCINVDFVYFICAISSFKSMVHYAK